ncbi:DUF6442 family protein [Dubosiella muris]|mgnify:CR=1 FL=1|uniref:Uncharacterized protein n=1 Tax=Dubosiella muris TaxID=3038133 RepID=A0AC61R5C6_9FIRM|nr:DUF6442 family protein [Dubosiella muris]TGY65090.1 hypothetical protein E5336_10325 [Dubosiella muris]
MNKEEVLKKARKEGNKEYEKEERGRYSVFLSVVVLIGLQCVLLFLRDHGMDWEATLFGQGVLTVVWCGWPLCQFIRTRNKENLLLVVFGLAAWGIPLLSTFMKGR